MARGAGDGDRREDAIAEFRRPFKDLHGAHRTADDTKQLIDPKMIDQHGLGAHHIADRDNWKIEAIGFLCRRIDRRRTGCSQTTTEDIRTNDEKAVRIDHLAGPDHDIPPAGASRDGVLIGRELVAGQGVTDQNRIGSVGVEGTICLIGDRKRAELDAAIEFERLLAAKFDLLARQVAIRDIA